MQLARSEKEGARIGVSAGNVISTGLSADFPVRLAAWLGMPAERRFGE